MLNESKAGPEADFWALGCIIYKLTFGVVPFDGANENQTFQKILNRELTYPAGADKDAIDLIDKLIRIKPEERIIDFKILSQHSFFKDINFNIINKRPVPFGNDLFVERLGQYVND
jgi:serine/threonine protein kinase